MRGAASSFGIITSIDVKTFATPSFATIYEYDWQLDYSTAAAALAQFQQFALTDIPSELGAEINIGKGNTEGSVYFSLTGGWYGESRDALQSALAPFLASMPWASVQYSGNGTYIGTIEALGNGVVNTKVAGPDSTDTFYAKSLMTPEGQPMTLDAFQAFTKYLAYNGYASNTVRLLFTYQDMVLLTADVGLVHAIRALRWRKFGHQLCRCGFDSVCDKKCTVHRATVCFFQQLCAAIP